MGITHLSGLQVAGVPTMGISTNGPLYTGNYWFVNETTGSDGNTGTSPQDAFATLSAAHTAATASNNDVVIFEGTIHLTATLTWSKNQVHLIGSNAPTKRGKRSRISVSGTTAFEPLVNVTAQGCNFKNFGTFYAFNLSATNNTICWQDLGGRNAYDLVEFLGFGDGTATTGTANVAGARALVFNNNTGESTFRDCVFGVDTATRNGTNYTIEIAGGAPRLTFQNCDFEAYLGSSGAASAHILIGADGIDRYLNFVGCRFLNAIKSGATAMTQLMSINGAIGGLIMLDQCTGIGYTHIETTPSNQVYVSNAAPSTAADVGIATNNHSS
jgi:hypothetical protein